MLTIVSKQQIKLIQLALLKWANNVAPVGKNAALAIAEHLELVLEDEDIYRAYRLEPRGSLEAVYETEHPLDYSDKDRYPQIMVNWIVKKFIPQEPNPQVTIRAGSLWDLYRKISATDLNAPRGLFEFAEYAGLTDAAGFMWEGAYWEISLERMDQP